MTVELARSLVEGLGEVGLVPPRDREVVGDLLARPLADAKDVPAVESGAVVVELRAPHVVEPAFGSRKRRRRDLGGVEAAQGDVERDAMIVKFLDGVVAVRDALVIRSLNLNSIRDEVYFARVLDSDFLLGYPLGCAPRSSSLVMYPFP